MAKITIKKVAEGRYIAYKDDKRVVTATFTKKYHPAPNLPVGFMVSFSIKGKPSLKVIVKNITQGKRRMVTAARLA